MQLFELKSAQGARKKRKIVGRGRGSGHGKTSCRGQKGQNSRSGRGILMGLEGGQMPMIRRIPKLGFRSKRPILYQLISLERLNKFKDGTIVTRELLKAEGIIKSLHKPFKVLGDGALKKSLTVQTNSVSKTAKEKIEKAGGKIEIIERAVSKEQEEKK